MKFRVTKTLKFGRNENQQFFPGMSKEYDTANLDEATAEQVIEMIGNGVERVFTPAPVSEKPEAKPEKSEEATKSAKKPAKKSKKKPALKKSKE